jgi:GrpB-like predicted nucleotidyltransferase (UPF0157 family)
LERLALSGFQRSSAPGASGVKIVEADRRWADEFTGIEAQLRQAVGDDAPRIDHIGSTSVPGLPAKDIIDVQITVGDEPTLERVGAALEGCDWRRVARVVRDHRVPGMSAERSRWVKALFDEPEGWRSIHVHVRIEGRPNQRYALLFRDYLRTHPDAAAAYAEVKRGLAGLAPDSASYADAKDPACDLIYLAAEIWAKEEGWMPR